MPGKQGGKKARTRTDLEHRVRLVHLHGLQQLALDGRLEHDLIKTDRDLDFGKRQRARAGRHEFLTLDRHEEIEHVLIQHLPRADLLLYHVEARFLEVHQVLLAEY